MFSLAHGGAEQTHLQAKDHWGPAFADPVIDSNTMFFQFMTLDKGLRKHVTQDKTEGEDMRQKALILKRKAKSLHCYDIA